MYIKRERERTVGEHNKQEQDLYSFEQMKIDLSVHVSFIVGSQGDSGGRLIDVVIAHFEGFDQLE